MRNKIVSMILCMLMIMTGFVGITSAKTDSVEDVVVNVSYDFPAPEIGEWNGYDTITMDGLSVSVEPGEPAIPSLGAKILLPYKENVENIEITIGNMIELPGQYSVMPQQVPIPISSETIWVETLPDSSIYNSNEPFPGNLYEELSIQAFRGYRIHIIAINPIHYIPATGKVYYYSDIQVKIDTTFNSEIGSELYRGLSTDEAQLKDIVDNPEISSTYPNTMPISASKGRADIGFVQSNSHVNVDVRNSKMIIQADSFQYVVVTGNDPETDLPLDFSDLIEQKQSRGIAATVVYVKDIYARLEYDGVDEAEKIRNFIKDAYLNWEIDYILLGGDDEVVPFRGVYHSDYEYTPSDNYFAALDGTWDYDGDGIYGESRWDNDLDTEIDEADLLSEVYIGRATVERQIELDRWLHKTISYERGSASSWENTLMLGEEFDDITWGADYKNHIAALFPSEWTVDKLYDKGKDEKWTRAQAVEKLNAGQNIVNHAGHASHYGVMGLGTGTVDDLTNDDYFFAYSHGCNAGAFDKLLSGGTDGTSEAVSEHFIFAEHAAFAVVMNARYGYYSPGLDSGVSQSFDLAFFEGMLTKGISALGQANEYSKIQNIDKVLYAISGRYYRGVFMGLNLHGDPEVHINKPSKYEWTGIHDGPGNGYDEPFDIVSDSNGNTYVAGTVWSGTDYDYGLVAYDYSGTELWSATYDGTGNGDDEAYAIAIHESDGNVQIFVTGKSWGGANDDYATICYDSLGIECWPGAVRYNGPADGLDVAYAIATDISGIIYVTGESQNDIVTIKYDSDGNQLWIRTYDSPDGGADAARAIAIDSLQDIYVVGYGGGTWESTDYITIRYDAIGNEQWVERYNGPANAYDEVTDADISLDVIYVTGYSDGDLSSGNTNYATVAYDLEFGTQLWESIYNGLADDHDAARAIAIGQSGNIFVTGQSLGEGTSWDYATVTYDSSGTELWASRYDGPAYGEDVAVDIVVDVFDNSYVAGWITGTGTGLDYGTLIYDSSGNQLDLERYNGEASGDDWANAMTYSNGRIYLTGASYIDGEDYDYATFAMSEYSPNLYIVPEFIDIEPSPDTVNLKDYLRITAKVENRGLAPTGTLMKFYDDNPDIGGVLIAEVDLGIIPSGRVDSYAIGECLWDITSESGIHEIYVRVVSQYAAEDTSDNTASISVNLDPDLRIESIIFNPENPAPNGLITITAKINNIGFTHVNPGIAVRFYDGMPGEIDTTIMGDKFTQTTIFANSFEDVELTWDTTDDIESHEIYVGVDPDNLQSEINEDNNEMFNTIELISPDLKIDRFDIYFDNRFPQESVDDTILLQADITNLGNGNAVSAEIGFYEGDPDNGGILIGMDVISVSIGETTIASIPLTPSSLGENTIYVKISDVTPNEITSYRSNNQAFRTFYKMSQSEILSDKYLVEGVERTQGRIEFEERIDTNPKHTVHVQIPVGAIVNYATMDLEGNKRDISGIDGWNMITDTFGYVSFETSNDDHLYCLDPFFTNTIRVFDEYSIEDEDAAIPLHDGWPVYPDEPYPQGLGIDSNGIIYTIIQVDTFNLELWAYDGYWYLDESLEIWNAYVSDLSFDSDDNMYISYYFADISDTFGFYQGGRIEMWTRNIVDEWSFERQWWASEEWYKFFLGGITFSDLDLDGTEELYMADYENGVAYYHTMDDLLAMPYGPESKTSFPYIDQGTLFHTFDYGYHGFADLAFFSNQNMIANDLNLQEMIKYDLRAPTNLKLDVGYYVGADGDYAWSHDGAFEDIVTLPNFASEINEWMAENDPVDGVYEVPLTFTSESGGFLDIGGDFYKDQSGLFVVYDLSKDFYSVSWSPDESNDKALILAAIPSVYNPEIFALLEYDGMNLNPLYYLDPSSSDYPYTVEWSFDGSYALVVGNLDLVLKYDTDTGEITRLPSAIPGHLLTYTDVEPLPDGQMLLVAIDSADYGANQLLVYDDDTESFTIYSIPTNYEVYALAWQPVEVDPFAFIAGTGQAFKWGDKILSPISDVPADIHGIPSWAPDGSCMLWPGYDGVVYKYVPDDGFELLNQDIVTTELYEADWHPSGEYAIIPGADGVLLYFDAATEFFFQIPTGTTNFLGDSAWRHDMAYSLIVGEDSTILKYPLNFFTDASKDFYSVSWNPDNSHALILAAMPSVAAPEGFALIKYTEENMETVYYHPAVDSIYPYTLEWSPDGTHALIVGNLDAVLRYDADTGQVTSLPPAVPNRPLVYSDVVFRDDGTAFLVGAGATIPGNDMLVEYDGTTLSKAVDLPTQWEMYTLAWREDPTDSFLFIAGNGLAFKWDGEVLSTISDVPADIYGIPSWVPDGSYMLWSSYDGNVYKYVPEVGFELLNQDIVITELYEADWHPTGEYAIIPGADGVLLYFDAATETFSQIHTGTTNFLGDSAWRHDASYSLIVGEDSTILKYPLDFFTEESKDFYSVSWNPDDSHALILAAIPSVAAPEGFALVKYTEENMETVYYHPAVDSIYPYTLEWSPGGDYALIVGNFDLVLRYDAITGQVASISSATPGRELVYTDVVFIDSDTAILAGIGATIPGNDVLVEYSDSPTPTLSKLADLPTQWEMYSLAWREDPTDSFLFIAGNGLAFRWGDNVLEEIVNVPAGIYGMPSWHPDGSYMLWPDYNGDVYKYDPLAPIGNRFLDLEQEIFDTELYRPDWHPTDNYAIIPGDNGVLLKYDASTGFSDISPTPMTTFIGDSDWKHDGSYALIVGEDSFIMKHDGS